VIGTDTPIAEIVENNGFGKNYRLFLRKFRQQYGCSPGEKRKQQQAG
jgi:AraC-like DNA-binding protein